MYRHLIDNQKSLYLFSVFSFVVIVLHTILQTFGKESLSVMFGGSVSTIIQVIYLLLRL